MGVSCRITLPPDCRARDVASVIGIALGCPKDWDGRDRARWVTVEGVHLQYDGVMGLVYIRIDGTPLTQNLPTGMLYHFEFGRNGERGLLPSSWATWIAVGKRLVQFFGGTVDFNDCDETEIDYERPHPPGTNAPERDEEWGAFQARMWALEPLTPEEIADAGRFAVYR